MATLYSLIPIYHLQVHIRYLNKMIMLITLSLAPARCRKGQGAQTMIAYVMLSSGPSKGWSRTSCQCSRRSPPPCGRTESCWRSLTSWLHRCKMSERTNSRASCCAGTTSYSGQRLNTNVIPTSLYLRYLRCEVCDMWLLCLMFDISELSEGVSENVYKQILKVYSCQC